MSSLATKYRPRTFEDVSGQDVTVQILTNMLNEQKPSSAFIFSGSRGTGKTTLARLLAKSLNCEKGVSATPCNECHACVSIDDGTCFDLLEIDAASNRGIDNVRQIQGDAYFYPENRFKVILFDEAHMLTREAFNALLKVLEEPPGHVVFVLATTELEKLPKTIQSRCNICKLNNLAPKDIMNVLARIVKAENINIDKEAVIELARQTNGSARDSLFLLEQLMFYKPKGIALDDVNKLCNNSDIETPFNLVDSMKSRDIERVFLSINTYFMQGGNAKQLLRDMLRLFRSILVTKVSDTPKKILNSSPAQERLFNMLASKWEVDEIVRAMLRINEGFKAFEYGVDEQTLMECVILEIM